MFTKKDYSTSLRERRIELRLTQQKVADSIGISRNYYSEIETGKKTPSFNVIEKINKEIPLIFLKRKVDNSLKREVK